jgi:hypothetical protein
VVFRKFLIGIVAAALCMAPAMAGDQDFTLHNTTGHTMKALFVAPSSSNDWGSDILGQDVLEDGQSVQVKFDRGESECKWDVRGEFSDGTYAEVTDVDFCTVSEVTFHS